MLVETSRRRDSKALAALDVFGVVVMCVCVRASASTILVHTIYRRPFKIIRPPCARPEKKRNSLIYIFSLYVYIYILLLYDYIRFRDTVVVIVRLMIVTRHYPRVCRPRRRCCGGIRGDGIIIIIIIFEGRYTFLLRFNL